MSRSARRALLARNRRRRLSNRLSSQETLEPRMLLAAIANEGVALDIEPAQLDNLGPSVVVADYRDDFQGGGPAAGWEYLWNSGGIIGDPANYTDLMWDGASNYDFDGNPGVPDADPLAWGFLNANGGHPGRGVTQNASGFDRFPIAAFTVAEDGAYEITNSFFNRGAGNNGEIQLVVHVNDNAPIVNDYNHVSNQSFDSALGVLSAGDTIYVGLGPNLSDGSDGFGWDFSIEKMADATAVGAATSAEGAAISVNADGTIAYDPSGSASLNALGLGATASDTFSYTWEDANGGTGTATTTVVVHGLPDLTSAVADSTETNEDVDLNIDVTANDVTPITVADFRDDFSGTTPATGWRYMWNSLGGIGESKNYAELNWDATDGRYDFDGQAGVPDLDPLAWGFINANGGHPGRGTTQNAGGHDRYVIAAYDVPVNGYYTISDSFFSDGNGGTNNINLYVHVDDNDPIISNNNIINNLSFNGHLGHLNAGETVYVGLGPNGGDGGDGFNWDFSIDLIPDAPEVMARYRNDFQGGGPAAGWQYLWNSGGDIGNSANYSALNWDGAAAYDLDGVPGVPDADPLAWGYLNQIGGHPGRGFTQAAAGSDRFVIAAYTIPEDGIYDIVDSLVNRNGGNNGEIQVVVHVNDDAPTLNEYIFDDNQSIDHSLGALSAGDVVYVGLGPNLSDGGDGFAWDFSFAKKNAPLVQSVATSAQGVTPTINADGTISYDAGQSTSLQALEAGQTAADTFTYTIMDVDGRSSSATVTVTVDGQTEVPNAVADTVDTNEDLSISIDVTGNDLDAFSVANYRTDFQGPTGAQGWQYLWNSLGAAGDPANYAEMKWDGSRYDFNGTPGIPDADPLAWGFLSGTGGHSGRGTSQSAGGHDRYAIAAYTIPEDGSYAITDSFVNRGAGVNNADVIIHVNGDAPVFASGNTVANMSMDTGLGSLSAGDVVYVGFGPAGSDGSDGFDWDFNITRLPDAKTTVAGYRDDFSGVPAAGWSYLWNSGGEFGTATNYTPMLYNGSYYDFDGINNGLPDANPLAWGNFNGTGGHAGGGINIDGTARYLIAAYEVPADGIYSLSDTFANNTNGGCGDGIDVQVYVNDTHIGGRDFHNGGSTVFDMELGQISAGDTIYVGLGPKANDGCDSFSWDFSIDQATVPNVSVAATSTAGATLTVNADGSVQYDPSTSASLQALGNGDSATDSFTYTLTNGGETSTAAVTLNIAGVDDGPDATDDVAVTTEDGSVVVDVQANDLSPLVLANYRADYQGGGPAPGWEYLWNTGGAVGDPVNYDSLLWNGAYYDFDGIDNGLPDANPLGWGNMNGNGGHPGSGSAQGGGGGTDRAVIAAYTVPVDGQYSIADSFFNRGGGAGNNISLTVHVNDDAPVVAATNGVANQSFDTSLGDLNAGDTIYVALGPQTTDGGDGFTWDFSVVLNQSPISDVADYRDDFQGGGAPTGWQYVWNENGPVGDTGGYSALNWNGSAYDFDGVTGVPDADPLAWGNLTPGGGHPGRGVDQNAMGHDRYVIAGYSVTEDGRYSITDSFFNRGNGAGNNLSLVVHVNDDDPLLITANHTANQTFDMDLGNLSAGDTVYVAAGPNLTDGSDSFGWDFTITKNDLHTTSLGSGSSTEGATISVNADGTVNYDPSTSTTLQALNEGETATDTFSYTVEDAMGNTATATATVTVHGLLDSPVAAADTGATDEDTAVDIDVIANDLNPSSVVANYQADFDATTPAVGWQYLWNWGGAIGDSGNYQAMLPNGNGQYDFDGVSNGAPDANPLGWGVLNGGGGHPGSGSTQAAGGFDRYVIAAYSVPYDGDYEITNSTFNRGSGAGNTISLIVHVNDDAPVVDTMNDVANKPFDAALGTLSAGDTVYVGLGPNTSDGADGFTWDFSIEFMPDVSAATPTGPSIGGATVTANVDGTLNYDPSGQFDALDDGVTTTDTFTYTITDSGNRQATETVVVTLTGVNDAPVPDAGGAYSINEGDGLTLDASGTTDADANASLTYMWDVDGDNDYDENITGVNPTLTLAQLSALGLDDGPYSGNVTVQVDDGFGAVTATTTLDIANVAPIAGVVGVVEAAPNDVKTFTFTANLEPSPADTAAGFTYVIDWGNGDSTTLNGQPASIDVDYSYPEFGDFEITVTVSDKDAGSTQETHDISIVPVLKDGDMIIAGGTDGAADRIIFSRSGGNTVIVRYNNVFYGPFTYDANTTLVAYGGDRADYISVTGNTPVPAVFYGEERNDRLVGGTQDDSLYGGAGNDVILGGEGNNYLDGGIGNDTLTTRSGADSIDGGMGNDLIQSASGNDTIDGGSGNDRISAGSGSDIARGGSGDDFINGGFGNDILIGGDDNDVLTGDNGNDILIGGFDLDNLRGGRNSDLMVNGTTNIDADDAALAQLLADWATTDSIDDRRINILNGGFVASDDAARDGLVGGGSADWFIISPNDVTSGFSSNDREDIV